MLAVRIYWGRGVGTATAGDEHRFSTAQPPEGDRWEVVGTAVLGIAWT